MPTEPSSHASHHVTSLHGLIRHLRRSLMQVPWPTSGLQLRMRETVWFSGIIIFKHKGQLCPPYANWTIKPCLTSCQIPSRAHQTSKEVPHAGTLTHVWTPTANARNGMVLWCHHIQAQGSTMSTLCQLNHQAMPHIMSNPFTCSSDI